MEDTRAFKLSLGDSAWGDYPFTEEDVALRLKRGGTYVAEINGRLAGSIALIWDDAHNWGTVGVDGKAGYIHSLMVGDKFRGQKLGLKLIDWAKSEVRAKGRPFLRLDCPANNKKLRSYYENLDFKPINTTHTTVFYQLAIKTK